MEQYLVQLLGVAEEVLFAFLSERLLQQGAGRESDRGKSLVEQNLPGEEQGWVVQRRQEWAAWPLVEEDMAKWRLEAEWEAVQREQEADHKEEEAFDGVQKEAEDTWALLAFLVG